MSAPPASAHPAFVEEPLAFRERPPAEMLARVREFRDDLLRRRTVRHFADRAVPREIVEAAIDCARHAPSGANHQPWHFVAIGREDADLRRKIRGAAEEEERAFYSGRAPQEWLDALAPLGTDPEKPFLEAAPWLIVVFGERWGQWPDGRRRKNYYVPESVGIACGFLIAALHRAGLATLTHTPNPMGFLGEILGRPKAEQAYLILVAGYPAAGAKVPVHGGIKKPLAEVATFR